MRGLQWAAFLLHLFLGKPSLRSAASLFSKHGDRGERCFLLPRGWEGAPRPSCAEHYCPGWAGDWEGVPSPDPPGNQFCVSPWTPLGTSALSLSAGSKGCAGCRCFAAWGRLME